MLPDALSRMFSSLSAWHGDNQIQDSWVQPIPCQGYICLTNECWATDQYMGLGVQTEIWVMTLGMNQPVPGPCSDSGVRPLMIPLGSKLISWQVTLMFSSSHELCLFDSLSLHPPLVSALRTLRSWLVSACLPISWSPQWLHTSVHKWSGMAYVWSQPMLHCTPHQNHRPAAPCYCCCLDTIISTLGATPMVSQQ